ncbi:MAG: TPM domain-containing protein [Candidatus Margulisbacteria bacterium]|nr:TPM domain-containing protein [Candidatus Margulisiibacteriota bacterium]
MRNITIILFSVLIAFSALGEATFPVPTGFINDYAGVLSAQEKQELESISAAIKQQTGAELAVAIVPTVEPLDSKTYAVKLFEKWKIGQKGKDNGILILLAMQEKRIEIEVGYGLEGTVPDALAGRILDKFAVPRFKQGAMGGGLVDTAKALSQVIIKGEVPVASDKGKDQGGDLGPYFIYVIIFIIVIGILFRRGGSIVMGIFGVIWGAGMGGLIGAILGGLLGLFFGFWGISLGGGGFGGGGFGGFGGGRSGGGGSGRSW